MCASQLFYFAYDHDHPTGGQKDTYQHVDLLRAEGVEAFILHMQPGFRLKWFANDTPVIDAAEFQKRFDPARDYVVVPEDLGKRIGALPGRKVIFNKNLYRSFLDQGLDLGAEYPYLRKDVLAAFAVSAHNAAHLAFAYPQLDVFQVDFEIQPEVFRPRALADKKPLIATIGKAPQHLGVLFHILRSRAQGGHNRGAAFEWRVFRDLPEAEVARSLGDALLFVFMSVDEGLGRMPLEAMASGALVTAYGAGPLREYLPPALQFGHGDIVSMVRFMEDVMNAYLDGTTQRFAALVHESQARAAYYSRAQQVRSVIGAWRAIWEKHGG